MFCLPFSNLFLLPKDASAADCTQLKPKGIARLVADEFDLLDQVGELRPVRGVPEGKQAGSTVESKANSPLVECVLRTISYARLGSFQLSSRRAVGGSVI